MTALLESQQGASMQAMSRSSRGQLDMSFNVEAERLAFVRRVLREHLLWWHTDDETADRVLIAVNELLTNVLQHTQVDDSGCRPASLLVQQVAGGITVIVRDKDPRPPLRVEAGHFAECGRGLALVRALVEESSVSTSDAGKDVWLFVAALDPGSTL